jgi:DNA ligase-1
VLDRFSGGRFTCEFKYDGERAQIHRLQDGSFKVRGRQTPAADAAPQVFSRNSEDNSTKYPDVVRALGQAVAPSTQSFILDSEVVAYSREDKRMLPFQILSTRVRCGGGGGWPNALADRLLSCLPAATPKQARKDVQSTEDVKVQVIVCAFDLLYLNGQSLLTEPFAKRRDLLREVGGAGRQCARPGPDCGQAFVAVPDLFAFAVGKDLADPEDILGFLHEAVSASCEGLLMIAGGGL